jgi:hypothetical protein
MDISAIMVFVKSVVGSISLKGNAFIGVIKKRPVTLLISISEKNRDYLVDEFFSESTLSLTKSNLLSYFYPIIN